MAVHCSCIQCMSTNWKMFLFIMISRSVRNKSFGKLIEIFSLYVMNISRKVCICFDVGVHGCGVGCKQSNAWRKVECFENF